MKTIFTFLINRSVCFHCRCPRIGAAPRRPSGPDLRGWLLRNLTLLLVAEAKHYISPVQTIFGSWSSLGPGTFRLSSIALELFISFLANSGLCQNFY